MEGIIDQRTALQTAQFASATSALFLAGYSFSFSQSSVPQLYEVKPQVSTPIFKNIYYNGAKVVPLFSIIATISSSYLAYLEPENRRAYLTAAITAFATQPWTVLVMMGPIQRLIKISEADEKTKGRIEMSLEHRQLMIKWVRQNWVRAGLLAVSGAVSLWTTLARF